MESNSYIIIKLDKLDSEMIPVSLAAFVNGENSMLQEVDLLQILYECIDNVLKRWDVSREEKIFTIACLNGLLHIFPIAEDNLEC